MACSSAAPTGAGGAAPAGAAGAAPAGTAGAASAEAALASPLTSFNYKTHKRPLPLSS